MSLRIASSATRILSPNYRRKFPTMGQLRRISTEKPSKPPKTESKDKPVPSTAESQVIEKGDTYKAGETYFSFSPYSYYDIEKEMQSKRLKQPSSSEKMKLYCQDKLNPQDKIERRLLPEEYGYLVEWPGKKELSKKYSERPVLPVVERRYKMKWDPETDPYYKSRMPL